MLLDPLRAAAFSLAFMLSLTGCADAAPADDLAARAVSEAKSMQAGRARDVVLQLVSRNLRYANRDLAIEAAAAMSEDYELRTFSPGPDKLTHHVVDRQEKQNDEDRACARFIERLKAGSGNPADDRRIRDCFSMDANLGIVAPPIPPFRLILLAADALPPGPTKARLLYMATWDSVPDRPTGGSNDAVRRLRALIPLLDGETRREAVGWLDTTSVDLIERRPDDAIARVRRGLSRANNSAMSLAEQPAMQARSLIYDFLETHDVERAVVVTNMLPSSADCAMVDDGLTGALD